MLGHVHPSASKVISMIIPNHLEMCAAARLRVCDGGVTLALDQADPFPADIFDLAPEDPPQICCGSCGGAVPSWYFQPSIDDLLVVDENVDRGAAMTNNSMTARSSALKAVGK